MNEFDEFVRQDVQAVCTVEDVLREVQGILIVDDLLAYGRSLHWQFKVMKEKGVLTEPILMDGWSYEKLRDFTTLPGFAKERLVKVREADYPIYQTIIGVEIEVEPKTVPNKIHIPKVNWGRVGKFTLAAAGVLAVGAVAVGAVALLTTSAVAAMAMADPKLIVVIDDGSPEEEMPWVCLVSWAKRPGS